MMITNKIKAKVAKIIGDLRPNDKIDYFILTVSLGLLIYTILFTLLADITYDEAYTYMRYSLRTGPNFLAFSLANNHPLNSLLIYLSSFLFPYREFFIRLPNILFLVLYLIYSIRVSKSKIFSPTKMLTFSFLTLYYFLIPTFFSQARGYGIAASLVLIFLYRFMQTNQNFKGIIGNFYILLLATSAFTGLLPLVMSVAVYYLFFEIRFKVLEFIKNAFIDIFVLLIGYSWLLYNLIIVSSAGKPLYGTRDSFIVSTLGYYLKSFSKFLPSLEHNSLLIICTILIAVFIFFFIKNREEKSTRIAFITILTFFFFWIASKFSGRPNITGRLLLPLFPLVALSFSELLLLSIRQLKISKKISLVCGSILISLIFTNFLYRAYKVNPKTVRGTFQKEIFENLNVKVKHDGCCSSIPFYLNKIKLYPPKDNPFFSEIALTEEIKAFYSFEKGVIFLEATDKADTDTRFLLHIIPENKEELPENRIKYGFDNNDFSWKKRVINNRYELIVLPNYSIKSLKIGQFDKKGRKWVKAIINDTQ